MSRRIEMAYKGARVDVPLQNLSLKLELEGAICDQILTLLTVDKWTGLIAEYGDAHRKLVTSRVFDRSVYKSIPTVDRKISKHYDVFNHALKDYVTERDMEEVEEPFMARADVNDGITSLLKIEKEYFFSSLLRASETFDTSTVKTLSGSDQFDDYTNSDPTKEIKNAKEKVWKASGKMVNACICPWPVANALRNHPKYRGTFTAQAIVPLTAEQLRMALDIQKVYVPYSTYANDSGQDVAFWGNDMILYHESPAATKKMRTFGFRISKKGHEMRNFVKPVDEPVNSDKIIVDTAYNAMITTPGAGFLLKDAISS